MAYHKGLKVLSVMSILLLLLFVSASPLRSAEKVGEMEKKEFNAGKKIMSHILDAYDWHIADVGDKHITIPLPVILYDESSWHVFWSSRFKHGYASYKGYKIAKEGRLAGKIVRDAGDGSYIRPLDLSITKNVFSIFLTSAFIIWLFISIAKMYDRRRGHAPKGIQSLLEPLILFIRDDIARDSIGEKHYRRFLPYLLTLFFFIFFNNLIGLIPFFPGGANVTGNIGVTGVLAGFTLLTIWVNGNKNYWKHIFNTPGMPWWLKVPIPLIPIIEIVGVFTKPFVLMVRLFANIAAGHIIILGFISLIFIFGQNSIAGGYTISVVSVGLAIFMNFLELLVAFIQAFVFTLLSAIFLGMAVEEEHH
jgi:F-type H+-transporting ATPase subunit a